MEGAVFTDQGKTVPIDEIQATGGIVLIRDWRAVESGISGTDIRDNFTKEQIVIVEINYDRKSAKLTPASARSEFERYIAELARISER